MSACTHDLQVFYHVPISDVWKTPDCRCDLSGRPIESPVSFALQQESEGNDPQQTLESHEQPRPHKESEEDVTEEVEPHQQLRPQQESQEDHTQATEIPREQPRPHKESEEDVTEEREPRQQPRPQQESQEDHTQATEAPHQQPRPHKESEEDDIKETEPQLEPNKNETKTAKPPPNKRKPNHMRREIVGYRYAPRGIFPMQACYITYPCEDPDCSGPVQFKLPSGLCVFFCGATPHNQ